MVNGDWACDWTVLQNFPTSLHLGPLNREEPYLQNGNRCWRTM